MHFGNENSVVTETIQGKQERKQKQCSDRNDTRKTGTETKTATQAKQKRKERSDRNDASKTGTEAKRAQPD